MGTIARIFVTYRPLRFFTYVSVGFALPGWPLGPRFVYHYVNGQSSGKVQSLLPATLLIRTGFLMLVAGLLADPIGVNGKLGESAWN